MGIPFGAIKVVAIASRRIDFMFVRRAVAAANSAGAIAMPTRVARRGFGGGKLPVDCTR